MTRYFKNEYDDFDPNADAAAADVYAKDAAVKKLIHILESIDSHKKDVQKESDGGLYTGPAGVAFALWFVASKGVLKNEEALLSSANELIKKQLALVGQRKSKKEMEGFLIGHSGVYAVGAVIAKAMKNDASMTSCLQQFKDIAALAVAGTNGSNELLVGRAGYVCGALWLRREFQKEIVPLETLHKICEAMLQSGEQYSKKAKSPSPLMYEYYETEYLGAAHGLSAILQMLISVPDFKDPKGLVKSSVAYMASLQYKDGNFPSSMDDVGEPESDADSLVHWCHGAPGAIYLFAKAHLHYKSEEFLKVALNCGECVWKKGLLKKGPGICHGVAGNAYAFLLLYRLTADKKHLYRAKRFAQFMESKTFEKARTPDCPYSLFEGLAGTACFLADMAKDPKGASFPFFDIFS